MKILILGGTGFIGKKLCQELLSTGHNVVVLTRNETKAKAYFGNNVDVVGWSGSDSILPAIALQGVDCIVNLAGESIGSGRWTEAKKEKIIKSRTETTRAIVCAIKNQGVKPRSFVSASAVGFYGPCKDEEITESAPAGQDFIATFCKAWESEAYKAETLGVRVVTVRIGVVLGSGGALERMKIPFRFYVGCSIGRGNQWFSWIHINDLVKIVNFVIANEFISGPVNATAPHPLKMRDFCNVLGGVMGRPVWLQIPDFVLRFALGEMADMFLNG
ncbi:MAG: TIGR01777 family oxidoreductase, partial [Nitrospirota bacterium]